MVGAGLGLVAAVVLVLVAPLAPGAAAVLALGVLAIVSGALHLDGLADTADALVAPSPAAAERARRDPRAGPAGVIALIVVLGLDWTLLTALIERGPRAASAGLIVAVTLSRLAAALAPVLARRPFRPGFGAWFAERTSVIDASFSLLTAAAVAVLAGFVTRPGVAVAGLVGLAVAGLATLALERLRGALDGDALGAIVEITLAATLLAAVSVP
jgi:adenosylcobinamide-GDP ribazoletransferase